MKSMRLNHEETIKLVNAVGRAELFAELDNIKNKGKKPPTINPNTSYLKAVRTTLIELGFDQNWVEGEFRDALEDKYLPYAYN